MRIPCLASDPSLPPRDDQVDMMPVSATLINQARAMTSAIERIKGAAPRDDVRPVLKTACGNLMSRGAELVILGCTELPLALDSNDPACPTLNPTRILAQAAIDWALGRTA